MFNTLNAYAKHEPTQQEALPGQVQNSAGGYSYVVDKWTQLERFLILGTTGGTVISRTWEGAASLVGNVSLTLATDCRGIAGAESKTTFSSNRPSDSAVYFLPFASA